MTAPLLDRLAGRRVAVVGDAMIDEYVRGRVSRISPEAPVPVVEAVERTRAPGGAANVAMNVAAAGGVPILVAVVGADAGASDLAASLGEARIDARLVTDSARPTTRKTRILAGTQQVVRLDEESVAPLPPAPAARLLEAAVGAVREAEAVILSDYDKGVFSPALLEAVTEAARRRGAPVIVDPNVTHFFHYKGVTAITPNHLQLERVTGRRFRTEEDLLAAGAEVLGRLGCGHLLVTRGEAGMTILAPGAPPRRIPARAREVFDVTGAGDTVVAVLALALAAGAAFAEAAEVANVAAGIVVGKRGTATASLAEIRAAIGS